MTGEYDYEIHCILIKKNNELAFSIFFHNVDWVVWYITSSLLPD